MSFEYLKDLGLGDYYQMPAWRTLEEINIDPKYIAQGPQYDHSKGYVIFRGITRQHLGGFIGTHWSDAFDLPYAASNNGAGDLFVAHLSLAELQQKEFGIPRADTVESKLEHINSRSYAHFMLNANPENVRLVRSEEVAAMHTQVPADLAPGDCGRINWRQLGWNVFGPSFEE